MGAGIFMTALFVLFHVLIITACVIVEPGNPAKRCFCPASLDRAHPGPCYRGNGPQALSAWQGWCCGPATVAISLRGPLPTCKYWSPTPPTPKWAPYLEALKCAPTPNPSTYRLHTCMCFYTTDSFWNLCPSPKHGSYALLTVSVQMIFFKIIFLSPLIQNILIYGLRAVWKKKKAHIYFS